ncbi:hypothetical protein NDU88_005133 [Pleurodeles waltl]|uniref:Uncharacterized protein n=1 Tax=Pleurodeles waltl TaxID=8319 RepID=A0AAV7RN88_PLEWA|nr:hypothetical protein NDU88_005133 [Pleurodeles waltl]
MAYFIPSSVWALSEKLANYVVGRIRKPIEKESKTASGRNTLPWVERRWVIGRVRTEHQCDLRDKRGQGDTNDGPHYGLLIADWLMHGTVKPLDVIVLFTSFTIFHGHSSLYW